VDKAGISWVEVPTAQALVAQLKSKAPDDNLVDDDLDHLNFTAAESEIVCQTSSQLYVLARPRETGLSGLVFRMVRFS
jgi:hypothetical protein